MKAIIIYPGDNKTEDGTPFNMYEYLISCMHARKLKANLYDVKEKVPGSIGEVATETWFLAGDNINGMGILSDHSNGEFVALIPHDHWLGQIKRAQLMAAAPVMYRALLQISHHKTGGEQSLAAGVALRALAQAAQ